MSVVIVEVQQFLLELGSGLAFHAGDPSERRRLDGFPGSPNCTCQLRSGCMPCSMYWATCSASTGLSTSRPTSVLSWAERGSRLKVPTKTFFRSNTTDLVCSPARDPSVRNPKMDVFLPKVRSSCISTPDLSRSLRRFVYPACAATWSVEARELVSVRMATPSASRWLMWV